LNFGATAVPVNTRAPPARAWLVRQIKSRISASGLRFSDFMPMYRRLINNDPIERAAAAIREACEVWARNRELSRENLALRQELREIRAEFVDAAASLVDRAIR